MLVEAKHRGQRWEDEPTELAIADLDDDEIRETVAQAIRLGRLAEPVRTGVPDLLRGLGLLTHDGEVTNAAAVLFARSSAMEPRLIQCQLKVTEPHNAVRVTFTRPGFAPAAFKEGLADEQRRLLDFLFARGPSSTAEIVEAVKRPRRSVQRDLENLVDVGRVVLVGMANRARWEPVKSF